MSFYSLYGKPLVSNVATLANGALSAVLVPPPTGGWFELYVLHITSTDTAINTVTVSDGTTTITYFTGGMPGGNNIPIYDQASIPVRFGKGATVTVAANAITAGKNVQVLARGLFTRT